MSKSSDLFKLPAGPAEICFDKNEFMKKTFLVDEFLQEHRNAATLETMRDDLGIYLKVLRSAMIELINEDYADFVNLSSNLVGLDQSIHGIQSPLNTLKDEIIAVRQMLEDTMQDVNDCLEQKRKSRDHLKSVQSLISVRQSMGKLRKLLDEQLNDDDALNPILLERAAMKLVQLKYDLQFCEHHIARLRNPNGLDGYNDVRNQLLRKIEIHFLKSLSEKSLEQLERCLRIYCTLSEQHAAEEIFRKEIVGPYMHPIISELSLQNNPHGLSGIYKQIIQFIDDRMKQLLTLTQVSAITASTVPGFDFLINSFWTEVERRLETHMASIFAPGNPDTFYEKYRLTMTFLERIEAIIKDKEHINRFHEHEHYKRFQTKWNLPVYFQIRFQEIGGALESACSKPIQLDDINTSSTTDFQLKTFTVGNACVNKCWADGFYLPQLFVRFFKLTLQILARVAKWADEAIELKNRPSNNTKSAQCYDRTYFLVVLYLDISKLIAKVPSVFDEIKGKIPHIFHMEITAVKKCFDETCHMFEECLRKIEEQWSKELLLQTAGWTKQVADIPRLYRKTNREAPSKPCNYVEQIIKPSKSFSDKYAAQISRATTEQCLRKVFSSLNQQYFSSVADVLTSVQKTEESLRRLKNLREKSGSVNPGSQLPSGMADDDKIRLQLHVDICAWIAGIEELGIDRNSIDKMTELVHLVEECTKIKISDK